ncbi:MAG: hypothetical protein RIQ93_591 [Verrucomicrobiota bacterium]|jgi:hypothetical protein
MSRPTEAIERNAMKTAIALACDLPRVSLISVRVGTALPLFGFDRPPNPVRHE